MEYVTTVTETKYKSEFKSTKYILYLGLMGKLWNVFCKYFEGNWPHYNGAALYIIELYVCNPVIMLGSYWLITHVDNTGIIIRGVGTAAAITEMRLGICFLDKKFCAFYKHDGNG